MIHNHEVGGSCPPLATLIIRQLQNKNVAAFSIIHNLHMQNSPSVHSLKKYQSY
jgi:hypothetical protein